MHATIERTPLLRALRLAGAAGARRTGGTPPLLRAVRLDADPRANILRLDATDGALALTQTIRAAVDGGWRRAVAARPLAALVADLPDGPLTLAAVAAARGAALALGAGDFRAILPALQHDASPAATESGPRCTPPLDAPELAAALAFVAPAAARADDPHPALAAICCAIETDGIVLTAVDGYRLARARLPFPAGERVALPRTLLIPARAVALYRRLLVGAAVAWLGVSGATDPRDETVHLVADTGRVVGRPVLAAAPRYDAAIPPDWTVRVTVDRAHLRRAARLARRVSAAEDPSLLLLPGPTGLRVVARDPDTDASLVAPLPAACEAVSGDFPPIALGARSLSDPLRLSPGRSITLAWRATNEAVTIGGTDMPDCRDRLWVVMPRHNPRGLERELRRRPAA